MQGMKNSDVTASMTFAWVMRICTWCGLIVLVVFGTLYLMGIGAVYDVSAVLQNWEKPVSQFWLSVRGRETQGYAWFLSYLRGMDTLAMTGILLLALTPLIALLSIIWKIKGLYLILLIILIVEFLFSVFWPLF
jgi:hypothetical protein